jgi:hypothetical protein
MAVLIRQWSRHRIWRRPAGPGHLRVELRPEGCQCSRAMEAGKTDRQKPGIRPSAPISIRSSRPTVIEMPMWCRRSRYGWE